VSVNKKEYSIMPGKKINKLLTTLKTIFQQKEFEESPLPAISTTHRSPKEDRKSLSSSKGHSSTIPRKSSSSSKEDRKPPSSSKGHSSSTSSHPKLSLKMYSLSAYAPNAQKSDVTNKKSIRVIPTTAATKKKTGK